MVALAFGCRFLIGVVFGVSAVSKLRTRSQFHAFLRSLQRMKVVPGPLERASAVTVAAAEVAIVLLMAFPAKATGIMGFVVALGLLAVFTAAIVSVIARKIDTTCRCFGKSDTPLGRQHVVRNLMLMVMAGAGLAGEITGTSAEPGLLAVAAIAGLLFGGMVTMFDDLVALFRDPTAKPRSQGGSR